MQIEVDLPRPHADQWRAFDKPGRFKAIRCGRRWGKTTFGEMIACEDAIDGKIVGYFVPAYKFQTEVYNDIARALAPVISASNKMESVIRTITGGRIDFWTLEDERAGRSRKYHRVIIDEAAFGPPHTMDAWEKSIMPTLLDYQGEAIVLSNTRGADPDNFFWRICNEPEKGFVEYHAPTASNPLIPERRPGETAAEWQGRRAAEFEAIQRSTPPLVYQQEYLAEFVDWSGVAFFSLDSLLVDGQSGETPRTRESVFAVIDTAVKTGSENDGTAVLYCGYDPIVPPPLAILDYDIVQIEGALLESWLPTVFLRLEDLARETKARRGAQGAWIEDKNSGTILLQQAQRRGWLAGPIESKLTAMGKDERAINASGYVYRGDVKLTRHAFEKVVQYKGTSRNHLISQVIGFRLGDKDAAKRADDLLDTFCYAVALSLGNSEGF